MDIISRLGYSDFFENSTSLEDLLKNIPLSLIIPFLWQLQKKEREFKSDDEEILFITTEWLSHSSDSFKKGIFEKYLSKVEFSSKGSRNVIVVNTMSTLRFIEYVLHFQNENNVNWEYEDVEVRLFKAYLYFNEKEGERQTKLHLQLTSGKEIVDEEVFFNYRLVVSSFEHQIQYAKLRKEYWAQILKFFQYLDFSNTSGTPWIKNTTDSFLVSNGIHDWRHYFMSIFEIVKHGADSMTVTFDSSENSIKLCAILDRYCFKRVDPVYDTNNFIELRKYPLFKLNDKYLILHLPFLVDKLFKAIYFDISEHVKSLHVKESYNFSSIYQQEFGEEFLLPNAIQLLFKKKYIQIKGKEVQGLNSQLAFPDYYVRNGNKVFLFENKFIKLSDSTKLSYDLTKFTNEIKEKLYITHEGKKKGLLQLLNCIILKLNGAYITFDKCKVDKLRFYPIIIVEDYSFCTFGVNVVVNKWFRSEIDKIKEIRGSKIKPLTIINIDDLLFYNRAITSLDKIIDDYHRFSNSNNPDKGMSFSDYLAFKFPNHVISKKDINHILTEPFKFYET